MRIKTELWVKAYLRRMSAQGAFATIVRRGDEDFGAVLVVLILGEGRAVLFGPAPAAAAAMGDTDGSDERRFVRLHVAETVPLAEVEDLVERQRGFDADSWVVEVEDRQGRHDLELARTGY